MILFAAIVLFLSAYFSLALPGKDAAGTQSIAKIGSGNNASGMYFSGKKLTEGVYMNAYLTVYEDIVSGGDKYTPGELSDMIDYYVSNENLAVNLSSKGSRSNESIGDILKKTGTDLGPGGYFCYMAFSTSSEVCCVDATSNPNECYVDSACQADKCVPNSGSGCYMATSIYGEQCCVDYTAPPGYCYVGSVCQGDLCIDQTPTPTPSPSPTPSPAQDCSAFVCGDGICDASFPYDPSIDEANPASLCCCELDCGIPCSSNVTTTSSTTSTTLSPNPTPTPSPSPSPAPGCGPLVCGNLICEYVFQYNSSFDESDSSSPCCCEQDCGIPCNPNPTPSPSPSPTPSPSVNQSCSMVSSIYGEPCCVDASLPQGYCYLDSICQGDWCVDQQRACYMTTSRYGMPCCVDSSVPSGYCYLDSACWDGVCVS